jgi:hypothetical protein
MWENMGVPMPYNHWVHFRVVRGASEAPDAFNGDFYGMYQALELPDGKNFLKARDLPAGNFYKMSDWIQSGEMNERYQAAGSVDYGEDFDNIRYNAHPQSSQTWLETNIDMPNWYSYRAIQEAVRHYDIFIEPTGRHRIKNLYWYFRPSTNPNGLGQLVQMPYDWDASFGPNWNSGNEVISNALHIQNSAATATPASLIDSPTWVAGGPLPDRVPMRIQLRNRIRETLDLMIYRNGSRGPCDDIIDDALARISPFYLADMARWPSNTGAAGHFTAGAPAKAQDMKNFLFTGWTDTFGADPAVPAGGRIVHLQNISDNVAYNATTGDGDVGRLPAKPTISYTGTTGYPVDGITFASSGFSDPQGPTDFGAYQWRVAEVTDPAAPDYDPAADRIYEMVDVWRSAEITNSATVSMQIPGSVLRPGHAYRARVRHRDVTGRYGHWSDPIQFIAGESNYADVLHENLILAEILYKPTTATEAEGLAGFSTNSFEFIELRNISTTLTLSLDGVRFTKGVDFDFPSGLTLAPGARILVVANLAAFQSRYPTVPLSQIAGAWDANQSLDNAGEELKLSFLAGDPIHQIFYDDSNPWPTGGDIAGNSIVYSGPNPVVGATTDPQNVGANWRTTYVTDGTPGGTDTPTLAEWMAANGLTDPAADPNGDGLDNCATFAFGHDLHPFELISTPVEADGEIYLAFTYTRRIALEGTTFHPEVSTNLTAWDDTAGVTVEETRNDNGDGTETIHVRTNLPISAQNRYFLRVRVDH